MKTRDAWSTNRLCIGVVTGAVALVAMLLVATTAGAQDSQQGNGQQAGAKNECVNCHEDDRFLVKNKKLYEYFNQWELSIHGQNNVTCDECHGGNPEADTKEAAHAGQMMEASGEASPISYQNIPKTCASCHDQIYERFRQSLHFDHLQANEMEAQGPNCVTCHGSVNTTVLTVNTVRNTCEECHNEQTGNMPQVPSRAEEVLNDFMSIHRFYRFITLRGDPEEVKSFFRIIDPYVEDLAAEWHTFDLDGVKGRTEDLMKLLKEKRRQVIEEARLERRRKRSE